jgi:hypothetical protein
LGSCQFSNLDYKKLKVVKLFINTSEIVCSKPSKMKIAKKAGVLVKKTKGQEPYSNIFHEKQDETVSNHGVSDYNKFFVPTHSDKYKDILIF